ncbi:MAG TPA: matrixin family metalloprotease [Polyangiaceae bacterium]|jgi:hypothetical protein|nr:matrixin family metalloprotease [Polyangiaceae bacterium]
MLVASHADAYCRTSACGDDVGARCTPATASDCGVPLFWATSCVGFSMQRDASSDVDLDTATGVVRAAFDTWQAADCGGGLHPSITASDLGPVDCTVAEYDQDTKNANIVVFRDSGWPYSASALALTTVTYALDTGEIRDADIELNSQVAAFTTKDTGVQVDLPSILTHETGHFLGLAHSPVTDATMQTEYPPKSTKLRTLEADDVAAICAVYPPSRSAPCDPTPVNGLGDACGEAGGTDEGGGCSTGGTAPSGGALSTAALALGVALAVRRARRLGDGRSSNDSGGRRSSSEMTRSSRRRRRRPGTSAAKEEPGSSTER